MKNAILTVIFYTASFMATAQGIAVQGIARDNASSAIKNTDLTFTFNITKNDNTLEYSETQSIRTDQFGVFSHVVSTGNPVSNSFSDIDFTIEDLKLKVFVNYNAVTIEVYNQPFQYTPYAHFAKKAAYANNATNATNAVNADDGVPTGAIMPYIGANTPSGWVLCDGRTLTNISGSSALRAIVGNNAPNLKGMFLRGTGTSPVNSKAGPSLRGTQNESYKSHSHGKGTLSTNSTGGHSHKITKLPQDSQGGSGTTSMQTLYESSGSDEKWNSVSGSPSGATDTQGSHSHTISGNTSSSGSTETRPVNYGVNYIIKL
jgi:hypothetical protein